MTKMDVIFYFQGVWMILAEMVPFVPKLNHNFIVDYWRNHAHTAPGINSLGTLMAVMNEIKNFRRVPVSPRNLSPHQYLIKH